MSREEDESKEEVERENSPLAQEFEIRERLAMRAARGNSASRRLQIKPTEMNIIDKGTTSTRVRALEDRR